jgi:S-adenosylmethionine decarboxylase proenzyme
MTMPPRRLGLAFFLLLLLVQLVRAWRSAVDIVAVHAWLVSALTVGVDGGAPATGVTERMGTHVLLEVHSAPFAVLNSSASVLAALYAAVAAGGLTVVGELVHEFPVQGCSAVLMISESHLSIHTWPERGYAAVDLFTCGAASPLPCAPREPVRFTGAHAGWRCASGEDAGGATGSLWEAVQALLAGLDAGGAVLTWLDRGMPASVGAPLGEPSPPPPRASFGWLGGLEGEAAGRPEL